MSTKQALRDLASQYRENYPGRLIGGVVVVYNGEACGWQNELIDPQNWCPGAIAVDEFGNRWEAVGGDDYNGAKEWRKISL